MRAPAAQTERASAPGVPTLGTLAELKSALASYGRKYGGHFTLFGSAARQEMHSGSDVDILVEFPEQANMDAVGFAEDTCWRLGLKPDIIGFGRPSARLGERVRVEGLVLPGDEERWSSPMSDEDRWGDILDAARAAASHFRAAAEMFDEGGLESTDLAGYRLRMAFYHAMQSAHTAVESALKRALVAAGEQLPSGAGWHKALVGLAAKAFSRQARPILDAELASAINETLTFRHFASHAYDAPFDARKARPAVEAGRLIGDRIEGELADFAERNRRT